MYVHSSRQLVVAGSITNLLHDVPQLCVSVWLLNHPLQAHHKALCNTNCVGFFAVVMVLCSAVALLYSLFNRLSAALLLRATRTHAGGARTRTDSTHIDTMMLEYMTALMRQSRSDWQSKRSRSLSISSLKSRETTHQAEAAASDIRLPRMIVPLVIDEIFESQSAKETKSGRSGQREKMKTAGLMAVEALLLHPIGDNQISAATTQAHEQILRRELDLHDESGFTSATTVSGLVNTILGHCVVEETQGFRLVFTGQRDKWGMHDAAAQHVLAQLRTANCSQPARSAQGRTAHLKVRRRVATLTSLEAYSCTDFSCLLGLIC
jgi:hypothetical protein